MKGCSGRRNMGPPQHMVVFSLFGGVVENRLLKRLYCRAVEETEVMVLEH